jgi:translocation and assembly module TamB
MTADTLQHDRHPSPKPPRSRKVVKWFVWLGVGMLALLLCAGLLLTYWFPSDMVRQELEIRLSELLQGTVRIHSLSFNLLTGLEVSQLEFTKPSQPPLTLEHLTLDYSLPGLLKGTFTIKEISIDRADVSLNLPELTEAAPVPTPPPPSEPAEPATLPTLPVSIDLETFKIIESNIHVVVSPELTVNLTRLNLQSSGGVSSDDAHLNATLQVEQLALALQGKHLELPLAVKFDAAIHLPSQHLELKQLTIESDPAIRLTLSGALNEFLTQKAVNLSLTDTSLNLETIMALAKDFVPPELGTATMGGTLSPSLTLTGFLPDSGFQGTIQAKLNGRDIELYLPDLALTVGPTDLTLAANDMQVKENLPLMGNVSAQLTTHHLAFQAYGIQNLDFMLKSDYQATGPFSGNLKISGTTALPEDLLGTPVNLPFAVALDTGGNHHTRQVQVKHLNVDLTPYGTLQMKGTLQPHPSPKEGMDASLEVRLSPKINALLSLMPKDQLQGLVLHKGTEPDTLVLQATGALHPDFRPEWAKATAALKLSSLRAQSDSFGPEGTMHQLTFLVSSGYQEKNGAFQGTVGLSSNLSNLRAADMLTIGTSHVILKSSFQGNLSPDYQPTSLRSQDQLQLTLGNLTYQDPSLTATLPSLRLSSKTKEDVLKHDYLLENLRVTSENLLDVNVKGRFTQAKQQFDVDFQMPLLHVGNLLPLLSGPLMKGVDEINPKGRVSLSLRAAGKVPQEADLKQLALPLGLQGTLTLRDIEGAVAGYRAQGGNGTMTLAYSPQATPQTQLTTDMTLKRIHLPDTLPISELADTSLHLRMMSPDLNEVQIDPIQVTSKGVDLFLKGAIVGLRELLSATSPRGTQLAKLFAQLHTRLGLDVETFQEALRPLGVQGNGKALVTLSMLKKEQGSLDASVEISAEALSLTRDGTELRNMNGAIQFRKSLAWKPDGVMSPPKKTFQPSDRVARLKSFSRKGQAITIDRLQLGPFTVQNFSTNLAFEQDSLKMQNLAMNLLGGGIGGNVIIAAERPLRVTAGLEVANLDANQLIKTESKIKDDSNIAATIGLTAILQDATGAVDLSRLEFNLHITHIGKEALDRLLVFLDPEGSNPTLSNARGQLKLANPSRVTVEAARGQLSLTIHFQGSLMPTFRLDRIPIAKMKNIETLTAAIPNWEDLVTVLELIGAETYSFTPEGEVEFQ